MEEKHRKLCKRFNEPGHAHFLTFSCNRQLPLFNKNEIKHIFISSLNEARKKHQFDLWGYVIMPEHIHILIHSSSIYSISVILKMIKQKSAYYSIKYFRKHSPEITEKLMDRKTGKIRFWLPGGGYDENITDTHACREIIDYMHNNPVRRGIVDNLLDWTWSSARFWAGETNVPIQMDKTLNVV